MSGRAGLRPVRALRRQHDSSKAVLHLALVATAVCSGCWSPPAHGPVLVDRTAEAKLDFVHFNGMSGELYYPEIMGSGGGVFDYDNDGDLDVLLIQGRMLGPDKVIEDAVYPPAAGVDPVDRLYRNDGFEENRGGGAPIFTDATESSGLNSDGYGMGVATGDYDNDGWIDLYITNMGSNQLWRNRGDGTFEDVTAVAGCDDPRWSTSATFTDLDADGWLDLYVVNYVDYSVEQDKKCTAPDGLRDYCGPQSYRGVSDRLFRNRGDGTFEDVSGRAGLLARSGAGLGVVTSDFDGDGWTDVYVANDGMKNDLWISQGTWRFTNAGLIKGVAVDFTGYAQGSMGVVAGDMDRDGDDDLFITHIANETNTFYANEGEVGFSEVTSVVGLAAPSRGLTGFGVSLLDFDLDGWLDLLVGNGAVLIIHGQRQEGDPFPLREPNRLLQNVEGVFSDVTDLAPVLRAEEVTRGVATGDVDNDGDPDVLLFNGAGPTRLLVNTTDGGAHWLGLRLVDRNGRDGLGARAGLIREGMTTSWLTARSDGSYLSANDPRILFGLGENPRVSAIEVHWPSGLRERWLDVSVDRYSTLVEGSGTAHDEEAP